MEDKRFISAIVQKCYEHLKDVDYKDLRESLIPKGILNRNQIERLDAKETLGDRSYLLYFDYAPKLGREKFKKLVDVISIDHEFVSRKVYEVWELESCTFGNQNQSMSLADPNPVDATRQQQHAYQIPDHATRLPQGAESSRQTQMGLVDLQANIEENTEGCLITGAECQADLKKYFKQSNVRENNPLQQSHDTKKKEILLRPQLSNDESTHNNRAASGAEIYHMGTTPRGVAFIINNMGFKKLKFRAGTDVDRDNLCKMFHYLGWKVTTKNDLTAKDMDEFLKRFARHESLNSVSAAAVAILTHGMDNDIYFGTDGDLDQKTPVRGTFISRFQLMQIFSSSNCSALRSKPKWFILQACRGGEEDVMSKPKTAMGQDRLDSDFPSPVKTLQGQPEEDRGIPDTGDMCCLFASSIGYKAYRMRNSGSPFIKALTETVQESASVKEFNTIMKLVRKRLYNEKLPEGKMTLPEYSDQLVKDWYLNPPSWTS